MGQMSICNVKIVIHNNKSTNNFYPILQFPSTERFSIFQLIVLVFGPTTFLFSFSLINVVSTNGDYIFTVKSVNGRAKLQHLKKHNAP